MRDAKPILAWAKAHGDEKIIERIVVRLLPQLAALQLDLTGAQVDGEGPIMVPEEVYTRIKETAERFIAQDPSSGGHVRHQ